MTEGEADAILRVKANASHMAEFAAAIFWGDGNSGQRSDFLMRRVHEDFANIAAALGYSIEKIETKEADNEPE